ncbi:alpha/beta hydrolase [Rhodohalobacter sp. 8-1]|uniref:alpha/beta hydrolase n=1 Tax=Rhodohalobacter sp. 8-1 TaxID=3131972 RepID=UPI0030ED6957
MKLSTLFLSLLFLSACTTIEINEDDAFDNHRTVKPESFSNDNLTLIQQTIETGDGVTLDTWQLTRQDARATVLYFGGNGFLMVKSQPLIEAYSTMPVNLVLFDYRGYGLSSGEPSVEGIQTDARAMIDVAQNLSEEYQTPLYVHGHSMGSFLSTYTAERNDLAGYILESPISEVESWTKKVVPWLLRPFVRFDIDPAIASQNNRKRVSSIATPLLIIGGTEDNITPFDMAEELYNESASSDKGLITIEGGNHNDLPYFDNYAIGIESFLFE